MPYAHYDTCRGSNSYSSSGILCQTVVRQTDKRESCQVWSRYRESNSSTSSTEHTREGCQKKRTNGIHIERVQRNRGAGSQVYVKKLRGGRGAFHKQTNGTFVVVRRRWPCDHGLRTYVRTFVRTKTSQATARRK